MTLPTKTNIPSTAVFIYDETNNRYIAWDGDITLDSGDVATEATLQSVAGLVTSAFDYVAVTYVTSGFGVGEIETTTYKTGGASGTTVATLTLTYDSNSRLSTVTST